MNTDSDGTPKRTWRSPLDASTRGRTLAVIEQIDDELRCRLNRVTSPALGDGLSGVALFFGQLAAQTGDSSARAIATNCLEEAIQQIGTTPLGPSLYGGFSGIAWTAAFFEPDASAEMFASIDEALIAHVSSRPWSGPFDVIGGLIGIGVYFLERLPSETARLGLSEVVARLGELAEHDSQGITWKTPAALIPSAQRDERSGGYYNLGVSHGVPGVISFLGSCCRDLTVRRHAEGLLVGAVDWLARQQLKHNPGSAFPYWDDQVNPPQPARTAWCYGDPGVAAALLVAAEAVDCSTWKQLAIHIARDATSRPHQETEVIDAPLCHGAAGLAHIFNRFWNATGDEAFRVAAADWFQKTLDLQGEGSDFVGFPTWKTTPRGLEWVHEPGFLEGAAGIGLALLSAIDDRGPRWDRVLLTCTD